MYSSGCSQRYPGNVFGRASAQVGKSSCGVLVVEPIGLSVDDKKTSAEGFDVVRSEVDHVFIWMQSASSRQCIWSCQRSGWKK